MQALLYHTCDCCLSEFSSSAACLSYRQLSGSVTYQAGVSSTCMTLVSMLTLTMVFHAGPEKHSHGLMPRRRTSGAIPGRPAQHAQSVHDVGLNADTLDADKQEVIDLVGNPSSAGKRCSSCCAVRSHVGNSTSCMLTDQPASAAIHDNRCPQCLARHVVTQITKVFAGHHMPLQWTE